MTIDHLKRLLWPHTLLPLAIIVAIDYVKVLGSIAQVALGAYVGIQLCSPLVGVTLAMIAHFKKTDVGLEVVPPRLRAALPILAAGIDFFAYLTKEDVDAPN